MGIRLWLKLIDFGLRIVALAIGVLMNLTAFGLRVGVALSMNLMMAFVGFGAEIDGSPYEFDDDLMKLLVFGLRVVVASLHFDDEICWSLG